MKTIKEAAYEYGEKIVGGSYVRYQSDCGFKAGVKFVQRWIPVEEELPPPDLLVLCKMKSNDAIVSGYISPSLGVPFVSTDPNFEFEDFGNYVPIAWRPINYK